MTLTAGSGWSVSKVECAYTHCAYAVMREVGHADDARSV